MGQAGGAQIWRVPRERQIIHCRCSSLLCGAKAVCDKADKAASLADRISDM